MTWLAVWIGSSIAFLVGSVIGYCAGYARGCRVGAKLSRELLRTLDDWRIAERPGRTIGHSIPGDYVTPRDTSWRTPKATPMAGHGGDWVNQELPS